MRHPVLYYRPTQQEILQFCAARSDAIGTTGTAQEGTTLHTSLPFFMLVHPVLPFVQYNIETGNYVYLLQL